MSDAQDLLNDITSNNNSSIVINSIFRHFYIWHRDGHYDKSSYILENVPVTIDNLDILVALLSITRVIRYKIRNRNIFYQKVKQLAIEHNYSDILKGLE